MTDLHDLFDRATDGIESPRLEHVALREAERRRTRRRGAVAASVAASLVVAALVGTQAGGERAEGPPPATTPTTPTTPTLWPEREPPPPGAGPITPEDTQPLWDPDAVADLPRLDLGLPADLEPTVDGGAEDVVAIASVARDDGLWLLGRDDGWFRLDYPTDDPVASALSPDGTRVAVVADDGMWWRPARGDWQAVDLPEDVRRPVADWSTRIDFVADRALVTQDGGRFWDVDLGTATGSRLPFDDLDEVVPAGSDILADRFVAPLTQRLEVWRAGQVDDLGDPSRYGSLQRPASDGTSVVLARATGSHDDDVTNSDGLLALALDGLTVRGFLPVPRRLSYYSDQNGATPVGWLDPDTVLAAIRPRSASGTTWLVTWDVETGDLHRAASYDTGLDLTVAFGVLAER